MVVTSIGLAMGQAAATERVVTGGTVRGAELADGSTIFRSIPYAKPPIGELRWRAPQPVELWQGVRDATQAGAPCLQRSYGWNAADAAAGSEDCLYLAVHSPPHAAGERLPVMVFIHGGANRAGSGTGFAESSLIKHRVVLVTMQYRLGIFGFLSTKALSAEAPEGASGNYALMDQIAALQWVRDNIVRFGGDPANVTIFGHSAGGQDVGLLMLSPLARGLFHKAIMQSGTPGFGVPPRTLAENEKIGSDLLRHLGLPEGKEGLRGLRSIAGEQLLGATDALLPPSTVDPSFIWIQAIVDGHVLPEAPATLIAEGRQAPVPIIIGNSVREFTVEGARASVRQWIAAQFGSGQTQALALYGFDGDKPPADDSLSGSIVDRISSDVLFRCPANFVANHQLELTPNVWRYELEVAKPGTAQPATHGAELAFIFEEPATGLHDEQWPPLQAYWTNFARLGTPNSADLPAWPKLSDGNRYMAFTSAGPRVGKDLHAAVCTLLRNP